MLYYLSLLSEQFGPLNVFQYVTFRTVGAAINVTMLTYTGTASVGVSSDDAAVTDREGLLESLRHGFREVIGEKVIIGDPISGK